LGIFRWPYGQTKEFAMKSLFSKSLVPSVLVAVSLALTGASAMAAEAQIHHTPKVAHVIRPHAAARVAARYRQPPFAGNNDLGQFIAGFFGGVMPQQYAHRRGSDRYVSSPSYDNSPTIDTSSAGTDAQAASDQESQQIQQSNDESALNASTAAAEQQNDAANAATLQTEINAGF
jgi:hypothetical protein